MREIVTGIRRAHRELNRQTTLALVRRLWSRSVFEHRMIAVLVLEAFASRLEAVDLPLLERFFRQSKTWALVDELAIAVAGPLVERQPKLLRQLDRWSIDSDFWLRRAAMLALLPALRRGEGDFNRFARYADAMLDDRQFFIRKAIGWVLRETGKRRPDLVNAWLLPRTNRASGVTVREAVRWLRPEQRDACLAAYASATGRVVTTIRPDRRDKKRGRGTPSARVGKTR